MKKRNINILRVLAFAAILCVAVVLTFALTFVVTERLVRAVGESNESTKNLLWLINNAQNLVPTVIVAILCAIYGKVGADDLTRAGFHREKKLSIIILTAFIYFAFMPYYISQNIAGNLTVFSALGDKALWFATQLIPMLGFIMYHSDREEKLVEQAKFSDGEEDNEE